MKALSVLSLKGGVGKTTLTVNLGAALSSLGKKVLLVDLDPQHDLTYSLGLDAIQVKGVEFLLEKDLTFEDIVIEHSKKLHVLPAGKKLKELELSLSNMFVKAKDSYFCYLLKNALAPYQDNYDYILFDCPPYAGFLSVNALVYANYVILPVQCQTLGLEATKKTVSLISRIRKFNKLSRRTLIVIPTMFDNRNRLSNNVLVKLRNVFADSVTHTKIRVNVALAEAPAFGKTVFEYKPNSPGAFDFLNLARELTSKLEVPVIGKMNGVLGASLEIPAKT